MGALGRRSSTTSRHLTQCEARIPPRASRGARGFLIQNSYGVGPSFSVDVLLTLAMQVQSILSWSESCGPSFQSLLSYHCSPESVSVLNRQYQYRPVSEFESLRRNAAFSDL